MKNTKSNKFSNFLISKIKTLSLQKNRLLLDSGNVLSVTDGIARIRGLFAIKAGELINFSNNLQGMILNLEKYVARAVIFGNDSKVNEGSSCQRTFNIVSIPVSDEFLGRVVDALGNPIDGQGSIASKETFEVDTKA
jgi:F0F1-type ATP synthase alpha subunit